MNITKRVRMGLLAVLALGLLVTQGWAGQQAQAKTAKPKVDLPAAVAEAVKANFSGAEIQSIELEKEAGIGVYDIEFKADKGEIEVAEDGTIIDLSHVVSARLLPAAVAQTVSQAAPGASIVKVEKSEIRAEVKEGPGKGQVIKLKAPKYVYEVGVAQGEKRGEIQVASGGKVVEALKWQGEQGEESEGSEEAGETPKAPDLKLLPPVVLSAFKTAYPKADIIGTSKETEEGVTYFEVESLDGTLRRDLLYAGDGKSVEIEEVISPDTLPAAVKQAVLKAHPGGKILKAEAMTRSGQHLFELSVEDNGKKFSLIVDPSGEIIKAPKGGDEAGR